MLLPDWVEILDENADSELEAVASKIMRCQNDRDAYALLDHFVRRHRKLVARRLLEEKGD